MTDSGKCAFVLDIELVYNTDGSATMCQRRVSHGSIWRYDPY
ncbi:hypothetical protein PPTG_21376 [Phytophthora nicotianae INRA-310]|uniref:Uncharacterized protein n=1 Tax=Phytophthora nicotianae (strain INRA-310) TaxID=761204 RepID=W2R6G9_PHYN3|nr:hypothetical protein PPTG_21376 [Phytophthora nicotianae INRA-310]ETN20826.1 hypothetical protein PPTG_21376 [Phytophthora nicotianae INRA-310]